MSKVQTWMVLFILVANGSIVFIRLESDPYRNVPGDKLRITQMDVADGGVPTISVNAAWVRGWYSDSVAALTTVVAAFLLLISRRDTLEAGGKGDAARMALE
jgi:hypothetical protein